jgi:hypothetical protein
MTKNELLAAGRDAAVQMIDTSIVRVQEKPQWHKCSCPVDI